MTRRARSGDAPERAFKWALVGLVLSLFLWPILGARLPVVIPFWILQDPGAAQLAIMQAQVTLVALAAPLLVLMTRWAPDDRPTARRAAEVLATEANVYRAVLFAMAATIRVILDAAYLHGSAYLTLDTLLLAATLLVLFRSYLTAVGLLMNPRRLWDRGLALLKERLRGHGAGLWAQRQVNQRLHEDLKKLGLRHSARFPQVDEGIVVRSQRSGVIVAIDTNSLGRLLNPKPTTDESDASLPSPSGTFHVHVGDRVTEGAAILTVDAGTISRAAGAQLMKRGSSLVAIQDEESATERMEAELVDLRTSIEFAIENGSRDLLTRTLTAHRAAIQALLQGLADEAERTGRVRASDGSIRLPTSDWTLQHAIELAGSRGDGFGDLACDEIHVAAFRCSSMALEYGDLSAFESYLRAAIWASSASNANAASRARALGVRLENLASFDIAQKVAIDLGIETAGQALEIWARVFSEAMKQRVDAGEVAALGHLAAHLRYTTVARGAERHSPGTSRLDFATLAEGPLTRAADTDTLDSALTAVKSAISLGVLAATRMLNRAGKLDKKTARRLRDEFKRAYPTSATWPGVIVAQSDWASSVLGWTWWEIWSRDYDRGGMLGFTSLVLEEYVRLTRDASIRVADWCRTEEEARAVSYLLQRLEAMAQSQGRGELSGLYRDWSREATAQADRLLADTPVSEERIREFGRRLGEVWFADSDFLIDDVATAPLEEAEIREAGLSRVVTRDPFVDTSLYTEPADLAEAFGGAMATARWDLWARQVRAFADGPPLREGEEVAEWARKAGASNPDAVVVVVNNYTAAFLLARDLDRSLVRDESPGKGVVAHRYIDGPPMVIVGDTGSMKLLRPLEPTKDVEGGRALALSNALARAWVVELTDDDARRIAEVELKEQGASEEAVAARAAELAGYIRIALLERLGVSGPFGGKARLLRE